VELYASRSAGIALHWSSCCTGLMAFMVVQNERKRGGEREREREKKKKEGSKSFLVDSSSSAFSASLIPSNNRTGHMQ
jgi:hypothetical protein